MNKLSKILIIVYILSILIGILFMGYNDFIKTGNKYIRIVNSCEECRDNEMCTRDGFMEPIKCTCFREEMCKNESR